MFVNETTDRLLEVNYDSVYSIYMTVTLLSFIYTQQTNVFVQVWIRS